MKQLFPTSPPLEIVYEPPAVLEVVALMMGLFVGGISWAVHRDYFTRWYWASIHLLDGRVSFPTQFDSVYAYLNVTFALLQALIVGMVVGAIARRYPYQLTALAVMLMFFAKGFFDMFELFHNARKPYEVAWVGWIFLLIYTLAPLYGAYVAQRIQRKFVR